MAKTGEIKMKKAEVVDLIKRKLRECIIKDTVE